MQHSQRATTQYQKNLGVAGPAVSLTGGAVRWYIEKIALGGPDCTLHEVIEQVIRTVEKSCLFHVRIHGNGGEIRIFQIREIVCVYRAVAETEDRKSGLVFIFAFLTQNIYSRSMYGCGYR